MKRKHEKISESSGQPKIVVLYSEDGGDSHEPPIGISGDPIYIDPPHDLPSDGESLDSSLMESSQMESDLAKTTTRYYKYKFARKAGQTPYFNLETVKVSTEKGDPSGYVNFVEYKVPRDRISSLHLWTGDTEGEPDIIVQGKNGGKILSVQPLDEQETSASPPKVNRKKRYYFPDNSVRVIKWAIVDDAGNILTDPTSSNGTFAASGDDQYYFYISFAHD
jgi:hypothetical protein